MRKEKRNAAILQYNAHDAAEKPLLEPSVPLRTHDYPVGSDVRSMLPQDLVHTPPAAHDLVDFHFHAMPREKRGNIGVWFLAGPSGRRYLKEFP